VVLVAPARSLPTGHPKFGGTLRIELRVASISLDPREWRSGSVTSAENIKLASLVFDRLITLDEFGHFHAALASDWSHDAASRTWQFRLRSGVKFSDNSLLTPKDVAAALGTLLPPALKISASEDGVQIRAAHPTPDLLEQLASGRYFIFRTEPDGTLLGTGPFILVESAPPTPAEANPSVLKPAHMKFRANEEAWAGRPFVDFVEVMLGDPPLRQILNLEVGRADIIDIPPDLVRKARQDNLRVWVSPAYTLLALHFDDSQPGASDPRLREALDFSLDRETMASVLLQRQALPATALLPQWLSGYAFLFGTPVDLDRAKELRSALPAGVAGAADPLRLRVDAAGDLMKLLGERVAVNARQAGISVQPLAHAPNSAGNSATGSPSPGLHLFAWHYDSLSPRADLQAIAAHLHSAAGEQPLAESSDPERLYAEERQLLEERQILPLVFLPEYVGIAPVVHNWSVTPSGEWRLADVWLASAEPLASNGESATGRNAAPGVHP
jgi:ABC-type transport system substrate-binding protein